MRKALTLAVFIAYFAGVVWVGVKYGEATAALAGAAGAVLLALLDAVGVLEPWPARRRPRRW